MTTLAQKIKCLFGHHTYPPLETVIEGLKRDRPATPGFPKLDGMECVVATTCICCDHRTYVLLPENWDD